MVKGKLHEPTPLEEFAQQSLPGEAYETQPTYSRPLRLSPQNPNANLPTGPVTGPSTGGQPAPTGGTITQQVVHSPSSQETRTDIGEQAAKESITQQLSPSSRPQDEMKIAPETPGAMRPTTREELLGPGKLMPSDPTPGPVIERRFSGQETISTEEQRERSRLEAMGRRQYETPLRHSLMVSETIVGRPEEHRDPVAQMGSTAVEFAITLPAHTVMSPVEVPRMAIETGRAIQEKGIVGWGQESVGFIMEKPFVRGTQLALVVGTAALLPVGKFVKGRTGRYSTKARFIETDMIIERGDPFTRGMAKSKITYGPGDETLVATHSFSRELGTKSIETRAISVGVDRGRVSRMDTLSGYRKGEVRPYREIGTELSAQRVAGTKIIEGRLVERGGVSRDVIQPGLESRLGLTRATGPDKSKTKVTVEAARTRTIAEIDTGQHLYKKTVTGELMQDIDASKIPIRTEPKRVIRSKAFSSSGKRIRTKTVPKTSIDVLATESAITKQIEQFSRTSRTKVKSDRVTAPGPVATTGPGPPLETGYPGPEVQFRGPDRSGFDEIGVVRPVREIPGHSRITKGSMVAASQVFKVRPMSGQRSVIVQRVDRPQAVQEVQMSKEIQKSASKQSVGQMSAKATRMKMIEKVGLDVIPTIPVPIMSFRSIRGRGPVPIMFVLDKTSQKPITMIGPGNLGRGFKYQPTLGGMVSGVEVQKIPKGPFTGLERRYPVKKKKKKK